MIDNLNKICYNYRYYYAKRLFLVKKIISLLLCAIIFCFEIGCDNSIKQIPLNEENAEKIVMDYLTQKYDSIFSVIDVEENLEGSFVIGQLTDYTVEVRVKNLSDKQEYLVILQVNDNKEYYVVKDNYMNTLVNSYLDERLNQFMNNLGAKNYNIYVGNINESGTKEASFFSASFKIPDDTATIEEFAQNYTLILGISIKLSESEKHRLSKLYGDNLFDYFSEKLLSIFDDDILNLYYAEYKDEVFQTVKEYGSNWREIPENCQPYLEKSEFFNNRDN